MIVEKLVIKTGTACSLRCEKCGEFNPYLAAKGKFFSADMNLLLDDVVRIASVVEEIQLLDIAGGEALIHRDLNVLISGLEKIDNIRKIQIASNGTIIPNNDITEALEKAVKTWVVISDYTAAMVDHTKVTDYLDVNGIKYRLIKDMTWVDKSNCSFKGKNEDELRYICKNCSTYRVNPYYTLIDGKLSAHCPTGGSLMYFLDLYRELQDEFIDLREIKKLRVEDLEQLDKKAFLGICNYCVPSYDAKKCMAGKQIGKR